MSTSLATTPTSEFSLTEKQTRANRLLAGPSKHVLLRGGSRSGKTFLLCRAIFIRALKAPESQHAIFRQHFNHLKLSIILDTMPTMAKLCFPEIPLTLNKVDWYHELPNGSRIVYSGLDDKERTEKVLGTEYATIYLNEVSQISFSSRNMAITRLAAKTSLSLKEYCDCNPPAIGHWTYKLWFENVDPVSGSKLKKPEQFDTMQLNPADNEQNLAPEYIEMLEGLPERERRRFLDGEYMAQAEGALWAYADFERHRREAHDDLPDFKRIVIAIDPAATKSATSDETGIVMAALGVDDRIYVLADLSGRMSPNGWAKRALMCYDEKSADRIVGEVNNGGDMVGHTIKTTAQSMYDNGERSSPEISYSDVRASRGKQTRAEPIAALYEQGRVSHVGSFPDLENQMVSWEPYSNQPSPDRLDALVWAITDLAIRPQKREVNLAMGGGKQENWAGAT